MRHFSKVSFSLISELSTHATPALENVYIGFSFHAFQFLWFFSFSL